MIIMEDFIPLGRNNRPGYRLVPEYITIHDTANPKAGADAASHAAYLKGSEAASRPASWHFTVDERSVYQHLPLSENGWHAGDGANGPGNRKSIGIEICDNVDGDRAAAEANAAQLVARLLTETGLPISSVVQHNRWTGKDCPRTFRSKAGGWVSFLERVEAERRRSGHPLPDEPVGTGMFRDVPDGHWAAPSIEKAAAAGAIAGIADGVFGLGQPVTREQLAVILDRLGILGN